MFYKGLLLLACYNLYKSVKSFINENLITKDGGPIRIPKGTYISISATVLFYLMVLAVCLVPTMLF